MSRLIMGMNMRKKNKIKKARMKGSSRPVKFFEEKHANSKANKLIRTSFLSMASDFVT